MSAAKARSKKRLLVNRSDFSYEFDITPEFVRCLPDRCWYSGAPVIFRTGSGPFRGSLERIDPRYGYTESNTAWCCAVFNGQKQWTREKFDFFVNYVPRREILRAQRVVRNGRKILLGIQTPLKSYFVKLLNNCKKSAERRGNVATRKDDSGNFDLTLEDLIEMLEIQKGRCYYSEIALRFGPEEDWNISCERLDPSKGYTMDNCRLIASEFQTSENWSKELVCFFRTHRFSKPYKYNPDKFISYENNVQVSA